MIAVPLLQSGIPIGAVSVVGKQRKLQPGMPSTVAALKEIGDRLNHRVSRRR
jgi:hypothetical protein